MEAVTKGASTAEHCRVLLMALAICSGAELAMQHNALESKKRAANARSAVGGATCDYGVDRCGHRIRSGTSRTGLVQPHQIRSGAKSTRCCRKPSSWECPGSRQRGGRRAPASPQPPPTPLGKQTPNLYFRHCCAGSARASRTFGGCVETRACLCRMRDGGGGSLAAPPPWVMVVVVA